MSEIDSQFSSNKVSPRPPQKQDGIFSELSFYVHPNEDVSHEIERLLREHDGRVVSYPTSASYIISNSILPVFEKNTVITREWVRTCIEHQTLFPTEPFATSDKHIFSSVVFCLGEDFTLSDKKALFGNLTYYGACYNESIQDCTHHITLGNENHNIFYYRKKKHVQPGIKVVSPDWVIDSIKNKKMQQESNYRHTHDPTLLRLTLPALEIQDSQEMAAPTDISSPVLRIITSPVAQPSRELANHAAMEMSTSSPFPDPEPESTPIRHFSSQTSESAMQASPSLIQAAGRHLTPPFLSTDRLQASPSITITPNTPEPLPETHSETPHTLLPQIPVVSHPRNSGNFASELFHKAEQPFPEKLPLFHNFLFLFEGYIGLIGKDAQREWEKIVVNNGGHIAPIYNPKVTHVILRHMAAETYSKALMDRKYIASAHWLNDVLTKEQLFAPCLPLHIPIKNPRPLEMSGFKISISNFEGVERAMLKDMISVLGANYTSYLSKKHNFLVTNKSQGIKYTKAKQWSVPIVNARFLVDALFRPGIPEHSRSLYRNVDFKEQLEIKNIDSLKPLLSIWSQQMF